jgi:hypothetical protein
MKREIKTAPRREAKRHTHSSCPLALSVTDDWDVHGDEQGRVPGLLSPYYQGFNEAPIAYRIQLEPMIFLGCLRDFLD